MSEYGRSLWRTYRFMPHQMRKDASSHVERVFSLSARGMSVAVRTFRA